MNLFYRRYFPEPYATLYYRIYCAMDKTTGIVEATEFCNVCAETTALVANSSAWSDHLEQLVSNLLAHEGVAPNPPLFHEQIVLRDAWTAAQKRYPKT